MILMSVINLEKIPTWRRFSTMTKVEMAKDIYFEMWIIFDIWCEKRFALCIHRANSIKIAFWTCNLWTGWSVIYKFVNRFWLNLHYSNSKKFSTSYVKDNSHSQMDISCHFDFCNSRRNALLSDSPVFKLRLQDTKL